MDTRESLVTKKLDSLFVSLSTVNSKLIIHTGLYNIYHFLKPLSRKKFLMHEFYKLSVLLILFTAGMIIIERNNKLFIVSCNLSDLAMLAVVSE